MRLFSWTAAALVVLSLAAPAAAQSARATGTVRDTGGRPIKGATVRAVNPDAYPSQLTSITDDKGRWGMIGLRTGTWTFHVEAEGFVSVQAPAPVRVATSPPLAFTLARDPGPIPDALSQDIQQQLVAANTLRDQGRLDQALAAYQDIRSKNRKLTAVNLVMADVYRKKAAQESDTAARRALLDRAIESYNEVLKSDASHERAKIELQSTRAEAAALR